MKKNIILMTILMLISSQALGQEAKESLKKIERKEVIKRIVAVRFDLSDKPILNLRTIDNEKVQIPVDDTDLRTLMDVLKSDYAISVRYLTDKDGHVISPYTYQFHDYIDKWTIDIEKSDSQKIISNIGTDKAYTYVLRLKGIHHTSEVEIIADDKSGQPVKLTNKGGTIVTVVAARSIKAIPRGHNKYSEASVELLRKY